MGLVAWINVTPVRKAETNFQPAELIKLKQSDVYAFRIMLCCCVPFLLSKPPVSHYNKDGKRSI